MAVEKSSGDESSPESLPAVDNELDHTLIITAKRLAFPTFVLLFCIMYLNSTWSRLDLGTLVYPYTILATTLILLSIVYISEIKDIKNISGESRSVSNSIKRIVLEWKEAIGIVTVAIGYLYIMDSVGFFPSSFSAIVAIMYIGGVKSWKLITAVSLFTLIMVYILFVAILGIRPPSGYIEIEFTAPW